MRAGGPFLALIGFLVMPLVWSVPEAIMTAELSVAFPEAVCDFALTMWAFFFLGGRAAGVTTPFVCTQAGFSAWTNAAFGPFWSFMCSVLSWISGVLDNAVYPVLMLEWVNGFLRTQERGVRRWHSNTSSIVMSNG